MTEEESLWKKHYNNNAINNFIELLILYSILLTKLFLGIWHYMIVIGNWINKKLTGDKNVK